MTEWMKCSEGLPPFGEEVLVWSRGSLAIASLEKDKSGEMYWECDDDEVAAGLRPPTHWRPLPPPPQV